MSMNDLMHRANIDVQEVFGKPLVVYEDHRSLVFVLWHALKVEKIFSEPPVLFYFDAHDDGKTPSDSALKSIERFVSSGGQDPRELYDIIEWELSPLDDDWLIAAFELGLVSDAVSVGVHHDTFQTFPHNITDHRGVSHQVWKLSHLWYELDYQGNLSDLVRGQQLDPLWDILHWKPCGDTIYSGDPRLVLDMDLDCFSTVVDGALVPWPELLLRERFERRQTEGCKGLSAKDFLRWLEPQVAFRTIAKESPYCGGMQASQRILNALDKILWNSKLFPF